MLKNKSTAKVDVRWNGKTVDILPGKTLDVSKEYPRENAQFLEVRFSNKSKGALEIVGGSTAPDTPKAEAPRKAEAPPKKKSKGSK